MGRGRFKFGSCFSFVVALALIIYFTGCHEEVDSSAKTKELVSLGIVGEWSFVYSKGTYDVSRGGEVGTTMVLVTFGMYYITTIGFKVTEHFRS